MSEDVKPLLTHLFRHESGKMISVLTKIFGTHNLELAEDVVQDTLLKAMDHWKFHGVPQNPTAWLFTAARNRALDVVRRERYQKEFAVEVSPLLKSEYSANITLQQYLTPAAIEDEQLRMMFVCCHPSLSGEAQIALILKTLCGFSVSEIASAFLTNDETITKRLYRARQQFREEKIPFTLPLDVDLRSRLDNILTAVYLIFNEGYNATHHDSLIREDLVEEALRLAKMLVDHPLTHLPPASALLALLCFQAARLYGRLDASGQLLQLRDQDRTKWNRPLIQQGISYLEIASVSQEITSYHLEAAIAYEHCMAPSYAETNWARILQLYDWLYQSQPDPLVALNRAIALAEVQGPAEALKELSKLKNKEALKSYTIYSATLGELHLRMGNKPVARRYFEEALAITHAVGEKRFLQQKIETCS